MALFNPTFIFGVIVLAYIASFVVFALLRIVTGISIQRIGYFSLRRLAYTPKDGIKIEIRGLGLNVHRPTFSQPTWLSIVVSELAVTVDIKALEGHKNGSTGEEDSDEDQEQGERDIPEPLLKKRNSLPRRATFGKGRSETWKQLTRIKEKIKRLHGNIHWLRMVDVVATDSTVNIVDVGQIQCGSFTIAVDTRRKMADRARFFFQTRAEKSRQKQQAEWIITLKSVLFTAHGGEASEILDNATLNVHGFLYERLNGLRDATIALKLGRVHVPYDDVQTCIEQYRRRKRLYSKDYHTVEALDVSVDKVIQELDEPGSTDQDLMQTVSDSKEFVSSILRGVKEVQFAVSLAGLSKKVETVKASGTPLLLNFSMKEVGIDLHRLDPKSAAHRMYFPSKDLAHEALAAALSISVGLDDGHGKPERLVYIPMATTTVKTTLPSKTVELSDLGSADERNANILFANSVVTSPSVDLEPKHLPILVALLRPKPKAPKAQVQERHKLISRLLPKANIKFTMHEPVLRVALPPVHRTDDPDDFDLIISSISSISLDVESFHSTVEDLHYSLVSQTRIQTHNLYYQTAQGSRFDLVNTELFDLKVTLGANPDVHVMANGHLQSLAIHMVRPEIADGLRQIIRQLRLDVEPDKRGKSKSQKPNNGIRGLPPWLLHFQVSVDDFSAEVAGVDDDFPNNTRGVALQVDSWSAEYRAQRMDQHLQRRPASRRRAASRAMIPDPELLKTVPSPTSPKKKLADYYSEGDGRRIAIHVRGLEAFIIDNAEKWEADPFVHMPRFEVALSTLSDKQGPIMHVHSHLKTLILQYSLYRHYAIGVAVMVLKKAFMRTRRDMPDPKVSQHRSPTSATIVDHLAPPIMSPSSPATDQMGQFGRPAQELVTVDIKANMIQIKADLPSDPAIMLQMYNVETGRHRWSPPFFHARLVRMFAGAPRMRGVWARIASIQTFRLDYRESRKFTAFGYHDDKMFDINAEAMRLAVPYELIIHKISDNFINVIKASAQLHHRFKTGTNEYILEKGPEGPKNVPKISLRTRHLLFELEDGAFEWKLGMIYRAGRVEQLQRLAREDAYRVKVKKIQEEELRKETNRLRNRSVMTRGRNKDANVSWSRSRSEDGRPRTAMDGRPPEDSPRGRKKPRYDPDGCLGFSGSAHVSIQEARKRLNEHNAQSWRKRIDRHYQMARDGMKDLRGLFWGPEQLPDDLEDHEKILEVPQRPALMGAVIEDLHFMIDKPSFPISKLADFLHDVGKGQPKNMKYSLLIPMNVQISMGQARLNLRDYPLPLLHIPALKSGQSSRLPAMSLKTDFVIAEEFRGVESTRKIKVQITPPSVKEDGQPAGGSFAIDVRRTVGPVKSYSDMFVDMNTAYPTRITWGPSYQPAIQDMMMVIESFTKPQLDPSERVGFWDKIRLNFHSRVRVSWKGDGDVHLALKGTRDPYSVTGNGAGFLMCWRNDVRWNINVEDEPKRFMTVDSGEYVLAIPDYSHQEREAARKLGEGDSIASGDSFRSGALFKKVVMKLSGNVQWMAGLVFEKAIADGHRSFDFKPHYDVVLKSPHYAKPEGGLPYDAFRGFRSQHIHLSIGVRAPVDMDWKSADHQVSRSYNTVHLTPRFFTHFYAWWSTFGGPMSLPVRQGSLWPGREKNSKKFGRHLGTIKYNILLAPLFMSHIYKHKDAEDYSENSVSATGIKVRFDSFMLDMHQRREEFNTRDRGRKTQSRTTAMKIHAAQLDLVSADVRAVSASIKGTTTEAIKKNSISTLISQGDEDGTDLSHFTIPDNDFSWIDMDDFVELDWILPSEPNPDTKILPLAFAPRVTYFRQTDIGDTIAGDPDRTSPFGHEPTHLCIMSQDDNPREVQQHLIEQRVRQLDTQIENNIRAVGEKELHVIRDGNNDAQLKADLETFRRHTGVLQDKRTFMQGMLKDVSASVLQDDINFSHDSSPRSSGLSEDAAKGATGADFASEFKNRFVIHNMQLKWNNLLRNIILRYSHQVSQRRGFVYYLSRPAVKFILDIVEEQAKAKSKDKDKPSSTTSPEKENHASGSQSNGHHMREAAQDIEHRIKQILQDGRKFVNADESNSPGETTTNVQMDDLTSGIAADFSPQSSYHVRLIAPQIQLQSEKNKKHAVLITARSMELKVVEVMEKARISDMVSGLVQRRFLVGMDGTQFFVTHQKWFTGQLLSLYSGNTYGTPTGSSWPPWVPMEIMFDFQSDPFGFKRVVQKTSALLRYDKYNTLRLKYNDDVNNNEGTENDTNESTESRMDNLWVEFPQARALCNSSQYYAIYVIVLDLLLYSEPLEKTRSERLEKIMLASDFSDLRGTPEMVIKLQERIRQLEEIKSHFQIHSKYLDKRGWQDRLLLERDLTACEDELFFMMKAITTSQRKYDTMSQSNALLRWSISAREIVWHLIRDSNEPLVELQLRDVEYDRTDNSDGSHINLFQVGKVLGLNLLPDAMYPEMVAPYVMDEKFNMKDFQNQQMIRVYWHMLEAIAGIPVMDHFEVNLFPLKIQLEREVGKKLFEYIFPEMEGEQGKNPGGRSDSPFMLKKGANEDDEDLQDESGSGRLGSVASDKDSGFNTRAGSLELRLRPTLTSDSQTPETTPQKNKALSVHSGDGHVFRLFNSKTASKKPSYESLRSSQITPRPGIGRTSTMNSTQSDNKKSSRFALRNSGKASEEKPSDDLSQMMDRASSYMTFAYIKMPSVVLCLSYKGKGDRNIEDVHDFVFRLPTIEYRNKTWSNLDLALALKSRVIKALISHTGAIIGNKFSKHRPNSKEKERLRELATSSVLLATPAIGNSGDNSDDSSSLFGTSPVDYSRSPPRSLRGSGSSIPVPQRSDSRSSSLASSRRSYRPNPTINTSQGNGAGHGQGAIPAFLMMTPPTPQDQTSPPTGLGIDNRPSTSSGEMRARPSTRGSLRPVSRGSALDIPEPKFDYKRRLTASPSGAGGSGGLAGLKGKFSALTNRLKDREGSGLSKTSSSGGASGESSMVREEEREIEAAEQSADEPEPRRFGFGSRAKTGL